ncbi:hypothetical protein [Cognatilysobacter bugurensis]|uniref:Uncharacterized protein n=1 Tax=Cognatilysobacter bugurensis TaxID=543356 RepID=A0A918W895_9GAMM|nr:hypothetical protein [Lysobacter bugurensis]GHA76847.1 hypothetical protein GCM10007067_12660 [Lysobacter bugurensis]
MNLLHTFSVGKWPATGKLVAVAAVTVAAAIHLLNTGYEDWSSGADTAYVLALLVLFFSKDKVEDERALDLKLRALATAAFGGWLMASLHRLGFYFLQRPEAPSTLSAFDVLFLILLIAHIQYHAQRHLDGTDR